MRHILPLLLVTLASATGACTTRLIDFTVLSTKNVDLSRVNEYQRRPFRTDGTDRIHIVLFVPFGSRDLKEAIDRSIESIPGAVALVNGVVYSTWFYFPLIYGQLYYRVEAEVLVDPLLASSKVRE